MIRTFVCARERVVLGALIEMVRADGRVALVGAVAGPDELLPFAASSADVVLVWTTTDAVDVLTRLRVSGLAHRTGVVVVVPTVSRELVTAAVDAGVRGFLLAEAGPDQVVDAIMRVSTGEAPYDPRATSWLLHPRTPARTLGLTDREEQILHLLADGMLNRDIAGRLGIAEATVKANMSRIYHRLGVDNRTQAASWAHANGFGPVASAAS